MSPIIDIGIEADRQMSDKMKYLRIVFFVI